jgi:hypothetical protein
VTPQNKIKYRDRIGGTICGLLVGLLIGLLVKNWYALQFDPKIDISDVAGLILSFFTLLVGYFIATNLDRTKKKEEYKYDFVFKKLDDFRKLTTGLALIIETNSCDVALVSSKLKGISIAYSDYYKSLGFCGLSISDTENADLKDVLLYLKKLCTSQRRIRPGEQQIAFTDSLELKIVSDKYIYSAVRVDVIKNQISLVNNSLFQYTIQN